METFILAFAFIGLMVAAMAIGVIFNGRTIKGSCGGLNAISDADQCLVCKKDVDPDGPLRERLADCPRARKMLDEMKTEA